MLGEEKGLIVDAAALAGVLRWYGNANATAIYLARYPQNNLFVKHNIYSRINISH